MTITYYSDILNKLNVAIAMSDSSRIKRLYKCIVEYIKHVNIDETKRDSLIITMASIHSGVITNETLLDKILFP